MLAVDVRLGLAGQQLATGPINLTLKTAMYESGSRKWATGEEMKVVLVLVLMACAAATALAYGNTVVTTSMTAVAAQVARKADEPAALLLMGSLLLGVAGAVKRFTL